MNLNFAEKVGIFLGATTLTFALGIAACSPVAPSVAKNQLGSHSTHQTGDGNVTPNPGPSGLHLLFVKGHDDATMFIGKDGFDWFFKGQSKNSEQYLFSAESYPLPLEDFKNEGVAEIELKPSNDWQLSADGTYSGTAALQLDLTNSAITPAQAANFAYELKAPSANDVRSAIRDQKKVKWLLQIKEGVDPNTRAIFLRALDGIRLTINTKDSPEPALAPAPSPNHGLEEEMPQDVGSQE
jgi:hypothetical protein